MTPVAEVEAVKKPLKRENASNPLSAYRQWRGSPFTAFMRVNILVLLREGRLPMEALRNAAC